MLQFGTITAKNLQVCNIGKENNDIHISKQLTEVEMDTKIKVEVEVDIIREANNRGISV